jgi:methylenetetrahydrofolate reductase (NADPH)
MIGMNSRSKFVLVIYCFSSFRKCASKCNKFYIHSGRWGDSTSPAFGELSDLSHFYSFTLGCDDDRRAMLGHCPLNESDVYEVFARYVEGSVPHIPWCETPLQPESFLIQPQLAKLNRYGYVR